jgi:hypothetical protein
MALIRLKIRIHCSDIPRIDRVNVGRADLLGQSATDYLGLGDCLYEKLSLANQPCPIGDRVISVTTTPPNSI